MSEDRNKEWVKGQLRDRGPDRFRRERARAIKETRSTANRFCQNGRIDRKALTRVDEEEE